jgi:mannose-1-phosphate guanylyltransferase/mannose-6-phosphate isomerase
MTLIPVILSGGAGARLWPVSREAYPKPFLQLPDGQTLIEKCLERACALEGVKDTITITNQDYYFHSRDVYDASKTARGRRHHFLLEPEGRNTAPAIALAAHQALEIDKDAVLLVLSADHLIPEIDLFAADVSKAASLALGGQLVTFGIKPDAPETGYGYLEVGPALNGGGNKVAAFVEKPDLASAQAYLASGRYLWNAGLFCLSAQHYLDALAKHEPELSAQIKKIWSKKSSDAPYTFPQEQFADLKKISVDYAVMEKAANVAVVPASFTWSDIGSWQAMASLSAPDVYGNRTSSQDVIFEGSENCFVQSEGRLVALLGLSNVQVIDTADALLVAHDSQSQAVKNIVEQLKADGHQAYKFHQTVHRPWGSYTVLGEGPGYKLKRIVVKPGASLSLQYHHHRAEHWVVIDGSAQVLNGEKEIFLKSNQSTFIPAGTPHRLANPGKIPIVMIEVQTGSYVGEDDIVRIEDKYGRS